MLLVLAAPGMARSTIGVFGNWAAISDTRARRCYAIAEPDRGPDNRSSRPFVSVGAWPDQRVRGQLNIRLRRAKLRGAPVVLSVGEIRFALIAGGSDAWAPNARTDTRIIEAIRQGTRLTVSTRTRDGAPMVDSYDLSGAATAIDAAMLACAQP